MGSLIQIQSSLRSRQDPSKFCSYNVEVIDKPTTPLIHQSARLWLIEKGVGKVKIQEREYELTAGMLVSILPWQITEITEVTETLTCHFVIYNFEIVNDVIKNYYNIQNEVLCLIAKLENTPVLLCDDEAYRTFENYFFRIRRENGVEPFGEESQNENGPYLLNQVVSVILEMLHTCDAQSEGERRRGKDVTKSELLLYIYSHLNEKLTLKQLSQLFHMSENSISSYITKTTGFSFFDLLNEMRVGRTIDFLLYTDLTLEELAEILGFVDSAHISKIFAARIGMKVNDYRRIYQNINHICKVKVNKNSYQVVSYIYRNFAEKLTIQSVADRFMMTTKELNRILLLQVEKNFTEFLNYIRVNRASELLCNTDSSVLEIAIEVGYSNEKALARNFLRYRLMTPGQFRNRVTVEEERIVRV